MMLMMKGTVLRFHAVLVTRTTPTHTLFYASWLSKQRSEILFLGLYPRI